VSYKLSKCEDVLVQETTTNLKCHYNLHIQLLMMYNVCL